MIRAIALCALTAWFVGCAPTPSDPNVLTGVVVYDHEPVWEGQLVLVGPRNSVGTSALNRDGSFRIVNPPLGRVQVAVTNYPLGATFPDPVVVGLPGQAECVLPASTSAQLPRRFAEPERSGITADIKPGRQHLELRLPCEAGDPPPVKRPDPWVGPMVGQVAMEVFGDDLDGAPLSLEEQRGNVVLLVFWAHWCNLCREEFSHYHALVERMKGRPFVMLGVNCDPDRGLVARENGLRGVNWRSWWDGAAVGGPVSTAWRLDGLPGVILIDRDGIVRRRNLRGADLDRAVDELVGEVHAEARRS